MSKRDNVTPSTEHSNTPKLECEDDKTDEMPEKELKNDLDII